MKILNTYILFVLLATVSVSCSKEVGPDDGDEVPITFALDVEETRGTPFTGTTLPSGDTFGVFTFRLPAGGGGTPGVPSNAIGQYMPDNQIVTKTSTGTECTYSPIKNWPTTTNDRLMFFACYPRSTANLTYSVPQGNTSDPMLQLTYTTDALPVNHKDLMYAATGPLYRTSARIGLQHALTRINFSATLAYPSDDPVRITRIQLLGVTNKGVLTIREYPGVWTPSTLPADKNDFDFSLNNGRLMDYTTLEEGVFKPMLQSSVGDLMLIPQDISQIYLEVNFTVTKPGGIFSYEKNFFLLPPEYPWEQGVAINYRLFVARDAIHIGAYCTKWNEAPGSTVIVES